MRKVIEQIKENYDKGLYSLKQIQLMYDKKKITKEEFDYIISAN